MQGDGEGLGQRRLADRDAVCGLVALGGAGDEALAEGALDVRERHRRAVEAHVEALVRQPLAAVAAGAAGPARRHGDPVADGEAGAAVADGDDVAGDLVAKDHRLPEPDGAEAAVVVAVQVGAADATGLDRDLDLAGTGGLGRALLDAEVTGGMADDLPLLRGRFARGSRDAGNAGGDEDADKVVEVPQEARDDAVRPLRIAWVGRLSSMTSRRPMKIATPDPAGSEPQDAWDWRSRRWPTRDGSRRRPAPPR